VVWLIVGGAPTARALEPLEAIVARAEGAPLAIVGDPVRQESRWEDGAIWTYTELAVRRSLGAPVSSPVVVRERGGVVGGIGQRVTHSRRVDVTRPHLLLLWRDPETGAWQPGVGGVLAVERRASEADLVGGVPLDTVWRALEGVVVR
jgi:hypothetical protein